MFTSTHSRAASLHGVSKTIELSSRIVKSDFTRGNKAAVSILPSSGRIGFSNVEPGEGPRLLGHCFVARSGCCGAVYLNRAIKPIVPGIGRYGTPAYTAKGPPIILSGTITSKPFLHLVQETVWLPI